MLWDVKLASGSWWMARDCWWGFLVKKVGWECSEGLQRLRNSFPCLAFRWACSSPVPFIKSHYTCALHLHNHRRTLVSPSSSLCISWVTAEWGAAFQMEAVHKASVRNPGRCFPDAVWRGWGSSSCWCGRLLPKTVASSDCNLLTLLQKLLKDRGQLGCTWHLTANPYFLGTGEDLVICVWLMFTQCAINFLWEHRYFYLDLIWISKQ